MTFNEYALCAHGYFLRHNRSQEPFRELYLLLWNLNTSKGDKIRSKAALKGHWPLLTDDPELNSMDAESIKDKHERALALTRKLKTNGKFHTGSNSNQ